MLAKRLVELLAYGQHRIEGGQRVLQNERDTTASDLTQRPFGQPQKIRPIEKHLAASYGGRSWLEADDGETGQALT
jgi:hypothetical protein